MKRLISIATLIACALPGYALADGSEPLIPADTRIKVLMYDESDVYTITTRYGYQTSIVFAPGEEIQTISVGDRSLWQIIPASNRLFIRPMEEDVITNMTVLTSKHSYQFDLKSIGATSKSGGNIYVAKFAYPCQEHNDSPCMSTASGQPAFAPPSSHMPAGAQQPLSPNYNYTYAGPDNVAPLQVYDDGKSTYIKYSSLKQPVPSAFAVESGKERPLTYYIKDSNTIVIDGVVPEIVLKSDAGVIHIYNETLNPG